ncbi:MAG: hypothetical protein V4819_13985 [Verrucomicrobiota bacterium]
MIPAFKLPVVFALAAVAASCASSSDLKNKEELAIAADFKVVKPVKPDQKAILEKLPNDQFTRITYGGKTYYVLPDKADHQAYVGGPKQFENYQQLSRAKEQAVEYNKDQDSPQSPPKLDGWVGFTTSDWSSRDGQTN